MLTQIVSKIVKTVTIVSLNRPVAVQSNYRPWLSCPTFVRCMPCRWLPDNFHGKHAYFECGLLKVSWLDENGFSIRWIGARLVDTKQLLMTPTSISFCNYTYKRPYETKKSNRNNKWYQEFIVFFFLWKRAECSIVALMDEWIITSCISIGQKKNTLNAIDLESYKQTNR